MRQVRYTFNFQLKKPRKMTDGQYDIYFRLTIDNDRKEKATNLTINPSDWHRRLQLSTGTDDYSQKLNERLTVIKTKVLQAYTALSSLDRTPTTEEVINKYLGIQPKTEEEVKHYLLPLFREHNEKCEELHNTGHMAAGTIERYKTSLKLTHEFIQTKYNKDDIELCDIDRDFVDEYEFFLKTVRKCNHNTTMKYLKNFRKIILIAMRKKLIHDDPYTGKRMTLEEVHPVFLEEDELSRMINQEFTSPRLRQVRDVFVFCCFTGLAFTDVKQLTNEHISLDIHGNKWIRKPRQKTKNMCNIPLLDIPLLIIEKYKHHRQCLAKGVLLPVPSNQKMNSYLKEIGDLCGIRKTITTHTARHTFATLTLANGVSIENVAKMLGHSDTKMTRHYAKILDSSILRDMESIRKKII